MQSFCLKTILPVLLLGAAAHGVTVGGIELLDQRDGLKLSGAGLLRKAYFFKVYVGALYLENSDNITHGAMRLDIHYFHNTPKKHMIRAAEKTLQQNLSKAEYARLLPKIEALHDAYLDGEPGACASLIHRPGEGLLYLFDGTPIIPIPGDDFAEAYFKVWLGENPSSRTMKNALLGGMEGREE